MQLSYGLLLGTMVLPAFMTLATGILLAQQSSTSAEGLPVKWEKLTAPNFIKAVELSGGTCVIPLRVSNL
jgi:hypothetical protein